MNFASAWAAVVRDQRAQKEARAADAQMQAQIDQFMRDMQPWNDRDNLEFRRHR